MVLRALILTSFLFQPAFPKERENDILNEVQEKYSKAKSIKMEVEKELTLSALRKTKKSSGNLSLASNGKFRLEMKEPDKSLIVIDGQNIWVVQYPEFKSEKTQVMHSKLKEQLKSQVLLSFLMGQGKIKKHFKILNQKEDDGTTIIKLEPKDEGTDLKNIELQVDSDEKIINKISYKDSLDNEISYKFSNNKFEDKTKASLFKFKPPKDAEVTEMN
jgi:outer membrane lipoprotein carrier protein